MPVLIYLAAGLSINTLHLVPYLELLTSYAKFRPEISQTCYSDETNGNRITVYDSEGGRSVSR